MSPLQVPGGVELLVLLLVLLFNLGIIVLVVAGGVFLYRRWRGDAGADRHDVEALRERVAELEREVERLRGSSERDDAGRDHDR